MKDTVPPPPRPNSDSERLDWLDHHCAFVADHEYCIGPFKVGQLREMADAGIRADKTRAFIRELNDGLNKAWAGRSRVQEPAPVWIDQ